MKLALFSDAHANPLGLKAVLDAISKHQPDQYWFLGDAVGYYTRPEETILLLRAVGAHCLLGNHDAMVLGTLAFDPARDEIYKVSASRAQLNQENRSFLQQLLPFQDLELDGCRILLVHGSPLQPLTEYVYPDADLSKYQVLPYDFIITAHTHRPFVQQQGSQIIANTGSCGMPRDNGASASFLILDTVDKTCEIQRVPMPVEEIIATFAAEVDASVLALLNRKEHE